MKSKTPEFNSETANDYPLDQQYAHAFSAVWNGLTTLQSIYSDPTSVVRGMDNLKKVCLPFEDFEKLSVNSKRNIVLTSTFKDIHSDLKVYLKILHLTGRKEIEIAKSGTMFVSPTNETYKIEEFYDFTKSSQNFLNLIALELDKLDEISGTNEGIPYSNIGLHLTTIILFSKYYSESIVTEVLSKTFQEKTFVSTEMLGKILENWNNLKDYPLEWVIELVSSETKANYWTI